MIKNVLVEYSEQVNVPICTGATSYTMESWEGMIIIFRQGLWFGNKTEKKLINPNQCQYFGIPLCDNPTNQNMQLGIEAYFNAHFPMSMVGFTCVFITWYSTDDDIDTCRHITISNEHN